MPRSMWKGAVSFGMVAIPVRLYLATESKSVSFRSLCPCHKQPIKQKRHCSVDDKVLDWKEVLKGFEISKDQFVVIDDEDLDNLPLASAHTRRGGVGIARSCSRLTSSSRSFGYGRRSAGWAGLTSCEAGGVGGAEVLP